MRGEIIQYFQTSSSGLISGEDGVRYGFTAEHVGRGEGLAEGVRVDFIVVDGQAREIYPLAAAAPAFSPVDYGDRPAVDLGLWGYFAKCMRMYFDGTGRARRTEYWSFILFRWVFMMLIFVVGFTGLMMLGAAAYAADGPDPADAAGGVFLIVFWIIGLPFLAPHYAVSARRLHDVGLNGWLALLMLIPYLGALFMFVIALIPSEKGKNQYGPYPIPVGA